MVIKQIAKAACLLGLSGFLGFFTPESKAQTNSIWLVPKKEYGLFSTMAERSEINVKNSLLSCPSKIQGEIIYFSTSLDKVNLAPWEYETKKARDSIKKSFEESLREEVRRTLKIGGFFGEVLAGRADAYTISSPFRNEGNPGKVYNPGARNHLTLNLWESTPYLSFKSNFGLNQQVNIRTDHKGAEAIFVQKNIFVQDVNFILGARMEKYDYTATSTFTGISYHPDKRHIMQLGLKADNYFDSDGADKPKGNIFAYFAYGWQF